MAAVGPSGKPDQPSDRAAAPAPAPRDEVLAALRRIIRATDLYSKQLERDVGMTVPQIIVMQSIRDLGEVTTSQVSVRVSLSQATVTSILDRLTERELVERYRSTRDRRIVHTRLTKKGKLALRKAPTLLHEQFLARFEELPARRQKEIIAALKDVAEMMGVTDLAAVPGLDGDLAQDAASGPGPDADPTAPDGAGDNGK
jgi:DNA-binding MarR family transcriptional regulator